MMKSALRNRFLHLVHTLVGSLNRSARYILAIRGLERKAATISFSLLVVLIGSWFLIWRRLARTSADGQFNCIYFVQTTGTPVFDHRGDCSLESAAVHNPDRKVIISFVRWREGRGPEPEQLFFTMYLQAFYPNIEWKISEAKDILPPVVLDWYYNKFEPKSGNAFVHISDALRYSIIYFNGGAYFDTDIISINTMNETKEFVSHEVTGFLCNGIFQFHKGSPFLLKILEELPKTYNANCWNCIGPALVDHVYNAFETKPRILEPMKFFPTGYGIGVPMEANPSFCNISDVYNNSYGIHLFNQMTLGLTVSTSIFLQELYRQNCPYTFRVMEKEKPH